MAAASRRFRTHATFVAWVVSCLPALAQAPRVELLPPETAVATARDGVLQPLSGVAFRLTFRAPSHIFSVRAADVDADGDLDLVTLGASGVHTWLNTGGGRFIEQSPARTIVRGRTSPCATAQARTRDGDAAVSGERPGLAARVTATTAIEGCRISSDTATPSLASRVPTKGGSRAPPASRT
jgi:hypothetical protein